MSPVRKAIAVATLLAILVIFNTTTVAADTTSATTAAESDAAADSNAADSTTANAIPAEPTAGTATDAGEKHYLDHIKPLLRSRCIACHGALRAEHGLRLDAVQLIRSGGDAGPAVEAGAPDESLLLDAVLGRNGRRKMPPEGEPLSADQVSAIERWVTAGAVAADETVPSNPRDHWSFQPPVQVDLPTNATAGSNPVDAFVMARLNQQGLQPSPAADRATLLRRVSLDLIGLPPTADELAAFRADESPQAYERVVDRLLASPEYGVRWARHWMDVWRYSDWDGFGAEVRESQPNIWRWRDWIIESLNADAGYDGMIRSMLAADELQPGDDSALRATGFLARNWFRFNRNTWMDNTVEHTGKAFLGITLNCCRCHDHMYDPFAQQEYYQFRAFFEPYDVRTDRLRNTAMTGTAANTTPHATATTRATSASATTATESEQIVRIYDAHLDRSTYLFARGNEKEPQKDQPLSANVPAVFGLPISEIAPQPLPATEYYPGRRIEEQTRVLNAAAERVTSAQSTVAATEALVTGMQAAMQAAATNHGTASADISAAVTTNSATADAIGTADDFLRVRLLQSELEAAVAATYLTAMQRESESVAARIAADELQYPVADVSPAVAAKTATTAATTASASTVAARNAVIAERAATLAKAEFSFRDAESRLLLLRLVHGTGLTLGSPLTAKPGDPLPSTIPGSIPTPEVLAAQRHLAAAGSPTTGQEATGAPATVTPPAAPPAGTHAWSSITDAEQHFAAAQAPLQAAQAVTAEPVSEAYTRFGTVYPASTSGRRTALARWITHERNPLAARVAVNHIWLRHFGSPLVRTVFDFGLNGSAPTHPELLDWLAVDLMRGGWKMKRLHRLIVTSNTYQQSSDVRDGHTLTQQADPDNRYLHRFTAHRLEAEAIRDSVLQVAGQLDTTSAGPDLDPEEGFRVPRRSIYFRCAKEKRMTFLSLFDYPNVTDCYRRSESIAPQQALALANSPLTRKSARHLAARLWQTVNEPRDAATSAAAGTAAPAGDQAVGNEAAGNQAGENQATGNQAVTPPTSDATTRFVQLAFMNILSREPSSDELQLCVQSLAEHQRQLANVSQLTPFTTGVASDLAAASDPGQRARENLVHVLLNHHDFVTVR